MSRTKTARPKYDGTIVPDNIDMGHTIDYKGIVLRAQIALKGCLGCYFTTVHGARYCEHLTACLGRYRKDKKSVIFSKIG